jgi:glycosyltransferase involved in cell wall biosynthesis
VKILYVLGSFYPAQSGGPNNTTYWAAKELARRGADVTVASLKDGLTPEHLEGHALDLDRENRFEGICAWYFDYKKNRYHSFSMFRWLLANAKRYDMVNLTSIFFPWSWLTAFLCILYRVPFSIAPRGELEPNAFRYSKGKKELMSMIFLKRLMARARFVMVTSQQEERYSRSFFPRSMAFETVPNYMKLETKAPSLEVIRKKRNILYLGRIHPKKGIENLIKAFGLLEPREHQLLIAGSGEASYVKMLETLAGKNRWAKAIHFLGHLDGEVKSKTYREAKIMVLPSYSENFGNVVLEALAHATPVVASRFTPWSGLENARCGKWVDNDPAALAHGMEALLSLDNAGYVTIANAAYRFVIENYDIQKNGDKLEKLYSSYL